MRPLRIGHRRCGGRGPRPRRGRARRLQREHRQRRAEHRQGAPQDRPVRFSAGPRARARDLPGTPSRPRRARVTTCIAHLAVGAVPVTVTQRDDNGNVHIQIADRQLLPDRAGLEDHRVTAIRSQNSDLGLHSQVVVRCPATVLEQHGLNFTCAASAGRSDRRRDPGHGVGRRATQADGPPVGGHFARFANVNRLCPRSSTSNRRSCCWSSSRPFDQRQVQLARRKQAKIWHPDVAPPGKQFEHERHLKAINEAADTLESLAEGSRNGRVSRNAVKASAAAARQRRAEEGAAQLRQRAARPRRGQGPRRARPVRRPRARPLGRAPLRALPHLPRVGRRLGHRHLLHRRGRRRRCSGRGSSSSPACARCPAGSLQFVDFSKPDPARRPRPALPHRRPARDRRRRLRARRPAADLRPRRRPDQHDRAAAADARLLAGRQPARRRPRGARLGAARSATAPPRTASPRASTRTWARSTSPPRRPTASPRARPTTPTRGRGVGRLRLRLMQRDLRPGGARARARDRARRGRAARPRARPPPGGDVGAEVSATEQATQIAPDSAAAWARHAHALARTDRVSDAIAACERALDARPGTTPRSPSCSTRLRGAVPRVLPAACTAPAGFRVIPGCTS